MQETERQLVEAIHAGEREALRRLYERYSRYAMGVSLRIVPEREDALDIVQDAFVSILTRGLAEKLGGKDHHPSRPGLDEESRQTAVL